MNQLRGYFEEMHVEQQPRRIDTRRLYDDKENYETRRAGNFFSKLLPFFMY